MKNLYFFILLTTLWLQSFTFVSAQQTVNVHFRVNTCAVPDTLSKNSVVQVRGDILPLTWDGSSPVLLTNLGSDNQLGSSDYWEGSAIFPTNTIIQYRFYKNHHDIVFAGCTWENEGWEADVNTLNGHRILDLSGFTGPDTILDLQFANGWQDGIGQYDTPYSTNDSTFTVYFRVNIEYFKLFEGFDTTLHKLGIRGSNTDDWGQTGEISWGTTYMLKKENQHANSYSRQYDASNFYSGAVHVPMQYYDNGIQWKFVIHYINNPLNEPWESMYHHPNFDDRVDFDSTGRDTTLYFRWYSRYGPPPPPPIIDTVQITYRADFTNAINTNGFHTGDTVIAIGCWNLPGIEIKRSKPLQREGLTNYYSVIDTVVVMRGVDFQYKYFRVFNSIEYYEDFYDFYDHGGHSAFEYRKVLIDSEFVTVVDDEISLTSLRRQPKFYNPDTLSQSITITYTCDLRPAYYRILAGDTLIDIGGSRYVYDTDSLLAWGVHINGIATGGWQVWGQQLADDTTRLMYDDGTHGDEFAGDTIYSRMYSYLTNSTIGQIFKFGVHGGDNEGGYGNLHMENIDDSSDTKFIRSQFGSIDPLVYSKYWDFLNQQPVGIVDQKRNQQPDEFILSQNYPNPFNPVTNIQYSLTVKSKVRLEIFNVIGEKVITLVDKNLIAGDYNIQWDGRDAAGKLVSSSIYFYRLRTENNSQSKKMLLLR